MPHCTEFTIAYGNPAVQTKVSICDTVWADEIDKAVDRFGWSFEQFFFSHVVNFAQRIDF